MVRIGFKKVINKQNHRGNDKYYQSKDWKYKRSLVKIRDKGICQGLFTEKGVIQLAGKYAVVDHIIPRRLKNIEAAIKPNNYDNNDFLDLKKKVRLYGHDIVENLWLVSKKYHDVKSAKEKRLYL